MLTACSFVYVYFGRIAIRFDAKVPCAGSLEIAEIAAATTAFDQSHDAIEAVA